MYSPPVILATIVLYLGLLIWVGHRADRSSAERAPGHSQPVIYGLSLATLCSAWTYFGGVGDASQGSWLYVANAMGPIIAITVGYPVWCRIATLSKQENVGSLADFLAARYGKSRSLGILTACVACLGALPYISLQLVVLTRVWAFAVQTRAPGSGEALILVALLAGFAIAFGARRPSLTQRNRGFVGIIALESCVKLAALLCVAIAGISYFTTRSGGWELAARALPPALPALNLPFVTLVLLCTVTAFTLPRQFHLGFVTLERVGDIRAAVWILPLYFLLWVLATLVTSLMVRAGLGVHGLDPYLQVIAVPKMLGEPVVALLALLGGLSAGAAMVIVETTAISAMVSNEIVLPLLSRVIRHHLTDERIGQSILRVRRGTILALALAAWLYYLGIGGSEAPTQLGLTALTAFAQLLPALVGGIYWRGGHARGALAGIGTGMIVWATAIAAPSLLPLRQAADLGAYGIWRASPDNFPTVAIYASLSLNIVLYIVVSLRSSPRLIDRIQADSFVSTQYKTQAGPGERIRATVGDVRRLLAQFLGSSETAKALLNYSISAHTGVMPDDRQVSPNLVRTVEKLLAGVIGAPSARNVVALALSAESQDAREISRILDEAGHAIHFSRELLQTTLESLPQAISVVDEGLRLVAWNTRYLFLMGLQPSEIYVGMALDALPAAGSDLRGGGHLRRVLVERLKTPATRTAFQDEREVLGGGRWRLSGTPLSGGDYLITLEDITDMRKAEKALARSNEELERRVAERTMELQRANEALSAANQVAERATGAQRRFVAAASHDLVQPLHASRLFIGNALVRIEHDEAVTSFLTRADQAVEAAHRLLRALLYLSQIEAGALKPKLEAVDAGALLRSLAEEFAPQVETRGLELVLLPTAAWVRSDRDLLRSLLQNLVLNALRYTAKGRVVVAMRTCSAGVRFEVRDTGVGIAPEHLPTAFREYSRLADGRTLAEGAGLGLSIVARIAHTLGHAIAVRSRPGRGSVFSVTVPATAPVPKSPRASVQRRSLDGLRVVCVDDERDVLLGAAALIERWGGRVSAFETAEVALAKQGTWDVAIADFQLGGLNGLEFLRALNAETTLRVLVTASPEAIPAHDFLADGIIILVKPLAPLALQEILVGAAGRFRGAC